MSKFFYDYNDDFSKIGDFFILGKAFSKSKLYEIVEKYFIDVVDSIVNDYDILNLKYYFIIGSCMPKNNILLEFRRENEYFPMKLDRLLKSDNNVKYVLKENDIKIDIMMFNSIFIELFNKFFTSSKYVVKKFGNKSSYIKFIQHKNLDCYMIFKILKYIYGKNQCINVWKQLSSNHKEILISINELISQHINNKSQMNRSYSFKQKVQDVRKFLETITEQDFQTTT